MKTSPPEPGLKRRFYRSGSSVGSWFIFSLFLVLNTGLSHAGFSSTFVRWGGTLLLLVVLFLGLWRRTTPEIPSPWGPPSFASWVILFLAAVVVRFWMLTSLSGYPLTDEGLFALFGMNLAEKWNWHFFRYLADMPPLYPWLLALTFKLFSASLTSFWALPAVLSLGTVFIVACGGRKFLRPEDAFCLTAWCALAYWPLVLGRLGFSMVLFPMVQWCLVAAVCWLLRAESRGGTWRGWIVGALMGLGFYIYMAWAVVGAMTVVVLIVKLRQVKNRNWILGTVMAGCFIVCLPGLIMAVREGYGAYFRELISSGGMVSRKGIPFWLQGMDYPRSLFWGPGTFNSYGPVWGGLFNPLATSLIFLGWVQGNRLSATWRTVAAAAFLLFLVPGMASNNLECLRMLAVLPLLGLAFLAGLKRLAESIPASRRAVVILSLVFLSSSLDVYHLFGPYHRHATNPASPTWEGLKSPTHFEIFRILEKTARWNGPGWIFQEFKPNSIDQTLQIATASFNAFQNKAAGIKATWSALLVRPGYRRYLEKRIPSAQWLLLKSDPRILVAIFPTASIPPEDFERWKKSELAFRRITVLAVERHFFEGSGDLLKLFPGLFGDLKGDPFLETVYWDKVSTAFYENGDGALALWALDRALKGYPIEALISRKEKWSREIGITK